MNGFNKACPEGNHLVNDRGLLSEGDVRLGDVLREDLTGLYWQVIEVEGDNVVLVPDVDTEKQLKKDELGDYFTN